MKRAFTIELKPEAARKMNRATYRATRSWLRRVQRMVEAGIGGTLLQSLNEDLVFYGSAVYRTTNEDGSLKMERISPYGN